MPVGCRNEVPVIPKGFIIDNGYLLILKDMTKNSIFFNHSFEKKRLKALISWIHKTFGEKEALRVVDELKTTGFINATRAGLSIGLHDLITPPEKPLLISKAQVAMNKTDQDFKGGKITATERSQRIIDTWHRTSDTLRKQVVDYFNTYDQLNSVYIMALSGARGNFSQVRQLIGMRGLMADPQGQIISFPIRSNFREGLTLTEYFISCSGARKGLVDTALRTADTGYLTRRLVDVSHQVVIKRVACNTSRGIVLKALQTGPLGGSNKTMLSLKDRLIGRVLAEDIKIPNVMFEDSTTTEGCRLIINPEGVDDSTRCSATQSSKLEFKPERAPNSTTTLNESTRSLGVARLLSQRTSVGEHPKKVEHFAGTEFGNRTLSRSESSSIPGKSSPNPTFREARVTEGAQSTNSSQTKVSTRFSKLAARDSEISPDLAFKIACLRDRVIVRSSLTCACIHEVCQLCYGWSLSQGKLVSLGEAVGVIAAQSIGEPGTQLTMRTFHTGGVFSGDLLQDIRAPHAGKVFFPQALQGLLVRNAQGQIAFLIKTPGALLLDDGKSQVTRIQLEAATMVFVRQGEVIESNTIIGELAVMTKEGNQPIKSRQTLFAEFGGRVTHHRGRTLKVHKPEADDEPLSGIMQWHDGEDLDLVKDAEEGIDRLKNGFRFIEPTHSLSLGVFRILATRVGAKESHLSKLQFTGPKLRLSKLQQRSNTSAQPLVVPGTEPQRVALRSRAPGRLPKKGGRPTTPLTKGRHADGHQNIVEPSLAISRRADLGQDFFDKKRSLGATFAERKFDRRDAPEVHTFRTPSYVLNTIAEEGDLVDENYKECTSSFQFTAKSSEGRVTTLQDRTPTV